MEAKDEIDELQDKWNKLLADVAAGSFVQNDVILIERWLDDLTSTANAPGQTIDIRLQQVAAGARRMHDLYKGFLERDLAYRSYLQNGVRDGFETLYKLTTDLSLASITRLLIFHGAVASTAVGFLVGNSQPNWRAPLLGCFGAAAVGLIAAILCQTFLMLASSRSLTRIGESNYPTASNKEYLETWTKHGAVKLAGASSFFGYISVLILLGNIAASASLIILSSP